MVTDINNPGSSAKAQSTVCVMMDQFGNKDNIAYFNHLPGGCNVLFMDGHAEFQRYPDGEGPTSQAFATFIAEVL